MAGVDEVEVMTGMEVMTSINDIRKDKESITTLMCENWVIGL
jgi:hypothetical protein